MESWTKLSLVAAVAVAAIAVFYRGSPLDDDNLKQRMEAVLKSLIKQEKTARFGYGGSDGAVPRIAIGYGACKDLFVDAYQLLPPSVAPDNPEHFNEIESESQLRKMFAYFFQHGAAAERFVSNDELFNALVSRAIKTDSHRWAVGGNAPVMALRFALEGAKVLLSAKITEDMRRGLHESIAVAQSSVVDEDDVHLILEYKREEKWGKYVSPRANRFIVHSDVNNPTVSSLEAFDDLLSDFRPNLFLVSGLQMMDNFPFKEGERIARLEKIKGQMGSQDFEKTRIHFEMASFVDETLLKELTTEVIPYADSLGMNEQELPNLYSMLKFGNITLASDSNPRIAVVLDQMRQLFQVLGSPNSQRSTTVGLRPLTRLHVHTLAYQAIMVKRGSSWKNTRIAAAKASLTANRHVCASKWIDLDKAFIIMDESFSTTAAEGADAVRIPFDDKRPVACWAEDDLDIDICIAPNLVCSEAKQTAGGGDNISAAGLVLQV